MTSVGSIVSGILLIVVAGVLNGSWGSAFSPSANLAVGKVQKSKEGEDGEEEELPNDLAHNHAFALFLIYAAIINIPICIIWAGGPERTFAILAATDSTIIWLVVVFSVIWGVGTVALGEAIRIAGVGLGTNLSMGIIAVLGTFLPLIKEGTIISMFGVVNSTGLAVCCGGLWLSTRALAMRDKDEYETGDEDSVQKLDAKKDSIYHIALRVNDDVQHFSREADSFQHSKRKNIVRPEDHPYYDDDFEYDVDTGERIVPDVKVNGQYISKVTNSSQYPTRGNDDQSDDDSEWDVDTADKVSATVKKNRQHISKEPKISLYPTRRMLERQGDMSGNNSDWDVVKAKQYVAGVKDNTQDFSKEDFPEEDSSGIPTWKKIAVCAFTGITCSQLQFAFIYGEPITHLALGETIPGETPESGGATIIWLLAISLAAPIGIANALFFASKPMMSGFKAPISRHVKLILTTSLPWITQIHIYGVCVTLLPDKVAASIAWPMLMMVTGGQALVLSVILGEWKTASAFTMRILKCSVLTTLIGLGILMASAAAPTTLSFSAAYPSHDHDAMLMASAAAPTTLSFSAADPSHDHD